MALSTQPYKGSRDFYPEDERLQKYIFAKWREVCESFGYEEYDAPILEPTELYLSKGNEEIINEQTFTFKDRGDRSVTLRTEMTPTVSRMVAAKRQELPYPLRWYSIPQCWRYERTQRGRGREFYQLNVDIFGVADAAADIEMIQMADAIMKAFGAKSEAYEIRINSRQLLNKRVETARPKVDTKSVIRLIDGFEKMSAEDFKLKLSEAVEEPEDLYKFLCADGDSEEVNQVRKSCQALGIDVVPTPSLARGFEYYTDIVFEVFDKNPDNNRSMFGGGRYDGLVELFGAQAVPTVGFGMGDITLRNFLGTHGLLPRLTTETDVYAVLIGDVLAAAQKPITELRKLGVNVAVDISGKKLGDQLKTAEKKGILNVLIIGEDELKSGEFTLKNLQTGDEQKGSVQQLTKSLK